jgi:hypothetical protein
MRMPEARGEVSEMLLDRLVREPGRIGLTAMPKGDPLADDDLHLALYLCYELHYRGIHAVDERWEWEPSLLEIRRGLEHVFESGLRDIAGRARLEGSIEDALKELIVQDRGPSLSRYLDERGTLEQFREFVVHRSAYQLKEADPHSWAIPRLDGAAKAALVEIQREEYGSGDANAMHAELFRKTMRGLGLDDGYGAYLDHIPGFTLASVNLMSLFGLHRRLRGAIVGHLAMFEMTSTEPNTRYAAGLRRLGAPGDVVGFYDEHVEADADHEIVAARGMAGGLIQEEPELAGDVLFGARSLLLGEQRFAQNLLDRWDAGRTSLRKPLRRGTHDEEPELRPAAAVAGRR